MGNVMKQADMNENPTAILRRLHRWRMAFFGLVILLAGVTLGVAAALIVVRPEPRPRSMPTEMAVRFLLERFKDELGVTPEQEEQLRAILQNRMKELDGIREKARPEIEKQLAAMKGEVSRVLTAEQQHHWEEMLKRVERMFQRGMRGGPGMPGGPGGPGGPGEGFRGRRERFRDPNGSGRPGERPPWRRRPGEGPLPPNDERHAPNRPDSPQTP